MQRQLKKYSSFFVLLLFLFPLTEKARHDFAHTLDTHCTAGNKHFHTLEHNCALCDFSINDTHFPVDALTQFVIPLCGISFNSVTESVNIPNAFQDIPSRGPPIVSPG